MQSEGVATELAVLDRGLIEQTVRDIHVLRAGAKFDALERYLAPEAVFEYIGHSTSFPYARRYCGKVEIINLFRTINTEIEVLDSELLSTMVDGRQAFSRRRVAIRHRGTGAQEVHEIWDIWKFRDGLVEESIKMIDISAYQRLQDG
jgi:hypothetical protein